MVKNTQKTFSISDFKARALQLLEEVGRSRKPITVTKYGKPLAQVIPFSDDTAKPQPDTLKSALLEEDDIVSPLGEHWWNAATKPDTY